MITFFELAIVLAVHHINQRPGLATVLDALKKHRSLASRSFLSRSQVFKQPLCNVRKTQSCADER